MSYEYTTENISLEIYWLVLSFLICYKIHSFIKPKRTLWCCNRQQNKAHLVSWTACKEHTRCILSIPHTPLMLTDTAGNSSDSGECTAQNHISKSHPKLALYRLDCKLKPVISVRSELNYKTVVTNWHQKHPRPKLFLSTVLLQTMQGN